MLKNIVVALTFIGLCLPQAALAIPGFMKARMGTISGQVTFEGEPLAKVMVAFFDVKKGLPPLAGAGHGGRIPDQILLSEEDGKFSHKMLQGSYYIGALIRTTEPRLGPPRKGEPLYFAQNDQGNLMQLSIEDFKKIDYGQINCVTPGNFKEQEETFTIEGVVLKGAREDVPFPGAIVLAKTSKSQFKRPEYVSEKVGEDGTFSLNLRPGPTFYLLARTSLTGQRPQAGEDIGRYSNEQAEDGNRNNQEGAGPPPGVGEDQPFRALNNEELPVTGKAGDIISGITIYLYDMPETGPNAQKPIQKEIRRAEGAPRFTEGVAVKVLFANDSHELDPKSFGELDEWARFLKGDLRLQIELNGHTDNVGDEQYNLELSKKRADSVAQYLTTKGIDPRRIKTNGYGSTMPYVDNSTPERRQKNRRVDIKFIR